MDIVLDEKQMALKSIETGYIDNKPTKTITILIKHYYSIGMNKQQIRENIESFMSKNYPNFNSVQWQEILDIMVKKYTKEKYNLIKVDSIDITQNELDKIKKLNNIKLEKLAFVYLVYAKILNKINDKNNNWVNKDSNIIFKTAKVQDTGKQQQLTIKQLSDLGYLHIAHVVNSTNVQVQYINSEDKTDIVISIDRFEDDLVLFYLKWKGEKVKICENSECSKMFITKNLKTKYCNKCRKEKDKEQKLKSWKKRKN
jgi:hypothetical protein